MAGRSSGRAVLAGCLAACLVGCTAQATGSSPPVGTIRVLQLNLCNSGVAACFTGRSTAEAAATIRAETPDLVTLNEVCQGDVAVLQRALDDVVPGGAAGAAFQAARNASTGEPYLCRNGEQYGIGIVSRWPSVPGSAVGGGTYPVQDRDDPEERAWLCVDAAAEPAVTVCTTHLTYTDRAVTLAQCRYLVGTVVRELRARTGAAPLIVAGDLNLRSGDGLRSCLPTVHALVDDGGVQHVVGTPELVVEETRTIDLRGATDHPGLLVRLGLRTR